MSVPKKTKSTKATKAEFDKVINALTKENEVFYTSSNQMIIFFISGLFTSSGPLILYSSSSIFEGKVREYLVWYIIVIFCTSIALGHSYNILASRTRKALLLSREPLNTGEKSTIELKAVTTKESTYYSLFSVNALYLVLFLLGIEYFLPTYQLADNFNFALSSFFSVLITATIVSIRML